MSLEYAQRKILEALKLTRGNAAKARQQIMAWTYEDPKLLQALTKPHLTGIVAHAVNRVITKQKDPVPQNVQAPMNKDESFGRELLKSIAGSDTAIFGQENVAPPISRSQASQNHIKAIQQIARKQPKK